MSQVKDALARNRWSFKKVKSWSVDINSDRILLARHKFSKKLIVEMFKGKRIVNIDEASFSSLVGRQETWSPIGHALRVEEKATKERITVTVAIDNLGKLYATFQTRTQDRDSFMVVLMSLVE